MVGHELRPVEVFHKLSEDIFSLPTFLTYSSFSSYQALAYIDKYIYVSTENCLVWKHLYTLNSTWEIFQNFYVEVYYMLNHLIKFRTSIKILQNLRYNSFITSSVSSKIPVASSFANGSTSDIWVTYYLDLIDCQKIFFSLCIYFRVFWRW